ncbi:MAG: hypothetical protein HY713_15085 [candidate division NC10 bacterium]|nr:hypothetical protein [candidate division NC10 bacterium]
MPLTHLGCPSCGGTLSLAEGQRVVSCRYCGGESLVQIPGAVPRYAVALGINREAARAAAQQFLTGPALPRALRERGRIQDVRLCYVPFYEFTGTRLGAFLLRADMKAPPPPVEDGGQDREFQRWLLALHPPKEDTRVIQQEYVRIGPACDLPELGVDRIRLQEMRRGATSVTLEPYDPVALQSHAVVLAPTKPPARFADESQFRIRVRSDRTGVVEQRLKILYYPVWQARYRHNGRPYEIAIDGVTGAVLCARAPVEIRQAAAMAMAALAVAALCFGRLQRQFDASGVAGGSSIASVFQAAGSILGLVLGGTVALLLAVIAWVTFRRPGEMFLGEGTDKPVLGIAGGMGALEGIRTRLTEWLLGLGKLPPGQG